MNVSEQESQAGENLRSLKEFGSLAALARRTLIPLLRGYLRYFHIRMGKKKVWTKLVEPYLAWQPHRFTARTVFGSLVAGHTDEILGQYIYYFGLWEPQITRWLGDRLKPGDTFIDVGANLGYYSLLASRKVGKNGHVIAIEASPKTFEELKDNLNRNRVDNIRALNVAVSGHAGTVPLYGGPASHRGLTTLNPHQGLPFECDVPAAPLADLLGPEEIQTARLIKIDIEGAELEAARGMGPLLAQGRPDLEILLEVHPFHLAKLGKQADDLLRIFQEAGFHGYMIDNDYSPLSYLDPLSEERLPRLRMPIDGEMNVVLSRRDEEWLL
jgi:FkbM family methyltransferase